MKAGSIGSAPIYNEGSSTIELIISFSVLILTMTAVLLIAFGNQSNTLYADLNQEALYKANRVLEDTRADAKGNYLSVVTESYSPETIYSLSREIVDLTPCKKRATARVTWQTDVGRPQKVEIANEFVNIVEALALGGDCADSPPNDDWDRPDSAGDIDFIPGGQEGTDVDAAVINGTRYAFTTSKKNPPTELDFWAVDVTDSENPVFAMPGPDYGINTGPGLNAVDVDPDGKIAYVASDNINEQLQVIDISDPTNPQLLLPSVTLPGVGNSYPQGWSIFYYDHHVFIGTRETAGNEFHVFDVTNPLLPIHRGSIEINHNVNDIFVRDQTIGGVTKRLAFLAVSSSAISPEVMILNIDMSTLPYTISPFGSGFDAPGEEDGTSIFLLGNTIFLGREYLASSNPQFYTLDASDLFNIDEFDSLNVGLTNNTAIVGIAVSGKFAFLATTRQTAGFQVWNIEDLTNIKPTSACNIYNYSEKATGIDYLDNRVYISNESNDALRIIWDHPTLAC